MAERCLMLWARLRTEFPPPVSTCPTVEAHLLEWASVLSMVLRHAHPRCTVGSAHLPVAVAVTSSSVSVGGSWS